MLTNCYRLGGPGLDLEPRGKQTQLLACQCLDYNSVALVREQTILIERPPLVGEVTANFCG
jgi:hypothetical protein